MNIIEHIPVGRSQAISRRQLASLTGLCDRRLRAYISAAREQGFPIVGDPQGGYYLAETEAERNLLLAELRSRIKRLAASYAAVRRRRLPQ